MNNSLSMLSILNGISKTLNIVNQMIPVYKQLKPIVLKSGEVINNIKGFNVKNMNNKVVKKTIPNKLVYNVSSSPTFFQ